MLTKYPPDQKRSAILGALYLVQEQQGYLTANGMRHVAGILDMTPAEVEDVATYYVMFYKEPVGKYVLQVCRTLSCALMGAERVTEALSEKLGLKVGETDASGLFTLGEFECLGACDRAPIVMVNNEHWHEKVRPEDAGKLVDEIHAKGEKAFTGCHSGRGTMKLPASSCRLPAGPAKVDDACEKPAGAGSRKLEAGS